MLDAAAKWIALALIALSVASPFLARESSLSFQQCQSQYEANTASQEQIKNLSFFIKRVIALRCTAEFVRTHDAAITAVATVLLTFVTGGLIWVGYMQIRTARAQLRAYVFVSSARVANVADGVPVAHVVIKNFGQTPAYKVVNVSGFALDRYPHPPTLNLLIRNREFSAPGRSRSVLAPTQSEDSIDPARRPPLRDEEKQALANGRSIIFLYGEVRYVDIFGRRQWTKYRLMMGGPVGVRSDGALVACEEGNEAT